MGPQDKDRSSLGYAGAIALSAIGHAALLYLALFALPRWLAGAETPPPAYTVKIVDSLPAGDLGTHLPKLTHHHRDPDPSEAESEEHPAAEEKPSPPSKAPKIDAPNNDPNAIALNNATVTPEATPEPTASPTPTPEPTATVAETPVPAAAPTQAPTAQPSAEPTREPTARPTRRPRPTARPAAPLKPLREKPHGKHHRGASPRPTPRVMLARAPAIVIPRAARTPSIKERLRQVREQLLKEHLQQLAKAAKSRSEDSDDNDSDDEGDEAPAAASAGGSRGGGPIAANSASNGRGYGVGPGTGSAGILKDPEFLLYYQKVQERIKDAWSFSSGNKELTTTVNFAIGPDGKLTGIEVAHSSNNASFDESVKRAIRRAAPFPPPPARYRDQFGQGVEAVFKLGDLSS